MSKDVEIVIGAKDQASAILRNVSSETKQMTRSVKTMASNTVQSTKKVEGAFQSLKAAAGPLLAAYAAFKGATAGLRIISDSAAAFDKQREAVRGLAQALEQSGDSAGPSIDQLQTFASELQKVTNVGDEVTLGLMKQASMMGVSNENLQDVTRAAIGLSEATGQGLEESLKKVNAAINGNAGSLQEMLPSIRNAATEEERLAIVLEASEKGLAQKAARAGEAAGSAERLSNSWGDFLEVIGEALAPVRAFISTGLAVLVETIQSAVIPALATIMPSAETVASAMAAMKAAIVQAVTVVEVVIGNFGTVWELASVSTQLYVTSIANDVMHAFTSTIPQYINWFSENFVALITDAFSAVVTVIKNRIKQMGDLIIALWDFVKSGFKGGAEKLFADVGSIASRNLLEGFQSQTKELPKIVSRSMTDGEQAMAGKIGSLAGKLGAEYRDKLSSRMSEAGESAGDDLLGGINLKAKEAVIAAKDAAAEVAKENVQKTSAVQNLTATESRLQTRGSADQASDKIAKNTEVMITKLADIAKLLPNIKPVPSSGGLQVEVVA